MFSRSCAISPQWPQLCRRLSSEHVHPTAIIEQGAKVGTGVRIGPFCVIGGNVSLGDGVRLDSHVRVAGHTSIGAGTTVFGFAMLGAAPQDLTYSGDPSHLIIGARCRIFEYAHLSGGTATLADGATTLGDDCLVMSHSHVGHDCTLGRGVVLAGSSGLAGHVRIDDGAIVSGHACVHQNVSIGRGAFLAGASVLVDDLIPYGLAAGNRAQLHSLNLRGLRRQSAPAAEVRAMLSAYRYLFDSPTEGFYPPLPLPPYSTLAGRAAAIDSTGYPRLAELVEFVLTRRSANSDLKRSLCQPPH